MQLNCFTQNASKFGKLSSSHRIGKSRFSSQSQRKGMPKNDQTTTKSHSFYMLVRWYSKSFKLGFNSMFTRNFQMEKLDLEKAEEPEIKLPASTGSWKKQESSRKTSTVLRWLCWSLWICGSQQIGKFVKRWEYKTTLPFSWETCMQVKK